MQIKQLSVRLQGKHIGVLEQNNFGRMSFSYDPSAKQAVSVGMPIREQPYDERWCEAFFGGLLPENEVVRKFIGMRFGISPNNTFSLLKAIGHDCAGAISFHEMREPLTQGYFFPLKGRIIPEEELYEHLKATPQYPLLLGFDELRLSLAGVQDKTAVCLINDLIALPEEGCPTTHILKPAVPGYEGIVANEYFCLRLAALLGLPVPHVELRQIKEIPFLLIARYDRQVNHHQVSRIHQEDFCQALGVSAAKKYQNEGGPGLVECFSLLQKVTQPAIARNHLMSVVVFNFLMGNMDAHGKNFSLLHNENNELSLAPFYDIVCTKAYPKLSAKMAMKIGGQYEVKNVLPRHWEQLCESIRYSYPALKKLITSQGDMILKVAKIEKENLLRIGNNISIIDTIIKFLDEHIHMVLGVTEW